MGPQHHAHSRTTVRVSRRIKIKYFGILQPKKEIAFQFQVFSIAAIKVEYIIWTVVYPFLKCIKSYLC
jgi:hypothetical protein